jgi:hypothetical protein
MGKFPSQRQAFLERIYREAEKVFIHVWEGKSRGVSNNHPLTPLGLITPP